MRVRIRRNNTTIASFPLASPDAERTVCGQDVKLFKQRAEKLRAADRCRKGRVVEVTGHLHKKEVNGNDGTLGTVTEISGGGVTPR